MRTIESTATVTNEGTLIVPAPDLRPGSYHVVVVIETASAATDAPPARPPMTPDEARASWARLRESMRDLPTPRLTAGEQLDTDRRERQALIEGSTG